MSIENLVKEYLSQDNLEIIPEMELEDAVKSYVNKDENNSIKE